jgi:hypothetical protein
MSISRRDALTGATAAVAVAAIPATVQANDALLEALYADWREAWGIWSRANTVADKTRIDALRSCEPSPVDTNYTSGAELEEAWDAWGAKRQAAKGRSDVVELKSQADAAYDVEQAAFNRLMEAPVSSARGVMFKLRGCFLDFEIAQIRAGDYDVDDLPAEYAAIIYRDLERLAGEASRPA